MAIIGIPPRNHPPVVDYSVVQGLKAAIEALSESSEIQQAHRIKDNSKILNRGRVICITSTRDDMNMKSLENIFRSQLDHQNEIASRSDQ